MYLMQNINNILFWDCVGKSPSGRCCCFSFLPPCNSHRGLNSCRCFIRSLSRLCWCYCFSSIPCFIFGFLWSLFARLRVLLIRLAVCRLLTIWCLYWSIWLVLRRLLRRVFIWVIWTSRWLWRRLVWRAIRSPRLIRNRLRYFRIFRIWCPMTWDCHLFFNCCYWIILLFKCWFWRRSTWTSWWFWRSSTPWYFILRSIRWYFINSNFLYGILNHVLLLLVTHLFLIYLS